MKIYLAAPFEHQGRMKIIRETLHFQPGLEVVSRWLDEAPGQDHTAMAQLDLSDIRAADVLILSEANEKVRGGMYVEFGYALSLGKKVAVVGKPYNIFQKLPEVLRFSSWPDCIAWLNKEQREHYASLSPINLVASISGRGSAGTQQQEADSTGPGDDRAGAAQGLNSAARYQRWVYERGLTPQDLAALRYLAEAGD